MLLMLSLLDRLATRRPKERPLKANVIFLIVLLKVGRKSLLLDRERGTDAQTPGNFPPRVVYSSMFEQSLLLDHAAGKKTGAMAASLTAQTLLVGVLIAVPLIFGDRLPDVRLFIPLSLPLPPPSARAATGASDRIIIVRRSSSTPREDLYDPRTLPTFRRYPDVAFVDAPPTFGDRHRSRRPRRHRHAFSDESTLPRNQSLKPSLTPPIPRRAATNHKGRRQTYKQQSSQESDSRLSRL